MAEVWKAALRSNLNAHREDNVVGLSYALCFVLLKFETRQMAPPLQTGLAEQTETGTVGLNLMGLFFVVGECGGESQSEE